MKYLRGAMGVLGALVLAIGIGAVGAVGHYEGQAKAEMSNVDPYAPGGWCDVVTVSEDYMWNPRTCELWVIRCPTDSNSCHMVKVEIRDE